jgi:hypothetical protein
MFNNILKIKIFLRQIIIFLTLLIWIKIKLFIREIIILIIKI